MKPAFPAAATPRTPTETPPTSAIALKLNGATVRLDIARSVAQSLPSVR
jgi:hypothetical protein